jgi:hypothetical protein
MTVQTYAVGEATIHVTCADSRQLAQLDALWRRLFSLRRIAPLVAAPPIRLNFYSPEQARVQPSGVRSAPHPARLHGQPTPCGYQLVCGEATLDLDLTRSQGVGVLPPAFWSYSLVEQRDFFLVGLLMLLHCHGYYGLHANGVVHGETGYLIIGESGAGKTTLTASLVQAGWAYLADDALVLYQANGQVEALGIRQGMACRAETLVRFPELAGVAATSPELAADKKLLGQAEIGSGGERLRCVVHVLLFPQVAGGQHSRLTSLDPVSALATLMRFSTGILTERSRVVQQMELLKVLVQQARAYQLHLGEDVFTEPATVASLLALC